MVLHPSRRQHSACYYRFSLGERITKHVVENMVTDLTFTYLTDALKEMYLRATLHRSLHKIKQYDGADDYMPPVIMFSKTRTVCTSEKLIDSLDILIMAVMKTYR